MATSHNTAAAATLEGVQICLACSTSTPEGSGRFCPECGAVLTAELGGTERLVANSGQVAETVVPTKRDVEAGSLVGTKVDGFSIESVIGGGAFGTVYRGRQLGLDRIVAIKVPTYEIAADPVMAKRFAREARSAARVDHPGVVAIYGVGELADGRPYLAMQMVDGQPLDKAFEKGPLSVVRALGIARQIASALSETHVASVVHRDLKPTNIMWRRDRNGDDRITLVDFGIAVCKPGTADATRLTAGNLIGTPHYMSPEQAQGEAVDARADLYALGCLLFEMVTGETPFDGSGVEVLLAHLGRPAPIASDKNPKVPEAVDRLILALMAKKPAERLATGDLVVELIDETLDALDGAGSDNAESSAKKPRQRRKTSSTKKDRPPIPIPRSALEPLPIDPVPVGAPTSRARWMAVGAALAFGLSVGGVLAVRFLASAPGATASPDDNHDPVASQAHREIFRDDGETRLRAWVPDPFVVGRARLRIELRNKLGSPIVADQMIVTVEDPSGMATAVTTRPRQEDPNQFGFVFEYKTPGTYHMRVFPPEDVARSPSTFSIPLDVVAK